MVTTERIGRRSIPEHLKMNLDVQRIQGRLLAPSARRHAAACQEAPWRTARLAARPHSPRTFFLVPHRASA